MPQRKLSESPTKSKQKPRAVKASTPGGRENQVIAMAYDLAEEQIRNGTASAQVLTHFLKMGSLKERLEREILAEQKKLVTAKTESLESSKRVEELYNNMLNAMRRYSGHGDDDETEDPNI